MGQLIEVAAESWLRQTVGAFAPMFLIGALLFWVQRWTQTTLVRLLGWRGLVFSTGWIGTPVHEVSHVLVGKLFGVRILEVRPFEPDERSGVLGYVRYVVPRLRLSELHQVVGTFLMGIAPLFGGALALLACRWLALGREENARFLEAGRAFAFALSSDRPPAVMEAGWNLLQQGYAPILERAPQDPWLALYLFASFAIATHLAPSQADLRGGMRGLLILLLVGLTGNVVALAAGADVSIVTALLAEATGPLTTLLSLALSLTVGFGAVLFAVDKGWRLIAE